MAEKIIYEKKVVKRHGVIELLEHWILAISGLLLLFTGICQMPIAKRYMITEIPGLRWTGNYKIDLFVHMVAGVVFTTVVVFHIFYHGFSGDKGLLPKKGDIKESIKVLLSFFGDKEEPAFHKYLPEQRLVYIFLGVISLVLIVTGIIKVYKNLEGVFLSPGLVFWTTWLHTIFTLLFLLFFIAHVGVLIFENNRPMVRGIITGVVKLEYAIKRHPHWIRELEEKIGKRIHHTEMEKDQG